MLATVLGTDLNAKDFETGRDFKDRAACQHEVSECWGILLWWVGGIGGIGVWMDAVLRPLLHREAGISFTCLLPLFPRPTQARSGAMIRDTAPPDPRMRRCFSTCASARPGDTPYGYQIFLYCRFFLCLQILFVEGLQILGFRALTCGNNNRAEMCLYFVKIVWDCLTGCVGIFKCHCHVSQCRHLMYVC